MGIDIGSLTAKGIILRDEQIIASSINRARPDPKESAQEIMEQLTSHEGLMMSDIKCIVGTGYGKEQISFAQHTESEITCHGLGAWWSLPSVRMVIDIGGQDAKAIRLDDKGRVVRYIYNDKCASGTGRFLEIMAEALEVPLEKMADLGNQAKKQITLSNQCVIFAESEVISLVNQGENLPDIVDGLHRALAGRVAALAKSIGLDQEVIMTGGVAKNNGVFQALQNSLGVEIKTQPKVDPQLNGALGAALLARQYCQ